jgi:hypothetical protein
MQLARWVLFVPWQEMSRIACKSGRAHGWAQGQLRHSAACLWALWPKQDGSDYLGLQLVKVQDTVPIHSAVISQKVALGALAAGRPWLDARMQALRQNRCPHDDPPSVLCNEGSAWHGAGLNARPSACWLAHGSASYNEGAACTAGERQAQCMLRPGPSK